MIPRNGPGPRLADLVAAGRPGAGAGRRGSPDDAGSSRAALLSLCAGALIARGEDPRARAIALHVPGRIEVIGKHTDYCGGRSLLSATEQGIAFVAVPSDGAGFLVLDARSGEAAALEVSPDLEPRRGHWSNYAAAVARRVARNFGARRGARVAFAGDLPPAAGMSSSSVLIIGFFVVLERANGIADLQGYRESIPDLLSLAAYLAAVENGSGFRGLPGDLGVGTEGGSEDHTAILASRPGRLGLFSYGPLREERSVPLPRGLVFAVAASGIAAEKTGAAMDRYNRASRLVRAAVEAWNLRSRSAEPDLAAVLRSAGGIEGLREAIAGTEIAGFRTEDVIRRAEHFHEENEKIVPAAVEALERGDLRAFGEAADRSQHLGARLLGNGIPETEFLAGEARRRGAIAASAFGAGFGGSVWALVEEGRAGGLIAEWRDAYRSAFPEAAARAEFLITAAAAGLLEASDLRPQASGRSTVPRPEA
jgi:galactokinase